MQNNITELAQRLLRALDNNYNVTDMATVIEVITLLEKVAITKEVLETTRLGKHINELRKNISNESIAKRAKALLKEWRNKVISVPAVTTPPDSNGQLIKPQPPPINTSIETNSINSIVTNDANHKKRLAKDNLDTVNAKRPKLNGSSTVTSEYDCSDNSNSSFKDALVQKMVILINSDSNSSIPDVKNEPPLDDPQPQRKRGRKKGSRNHKNLLDDAETSFSNKMAVSRGNAKVKTTQELVAGLQNKNLTSPAKVIENWDEKAAKLTERVSFIDQKLNTSANRYKKSLMKAKDVRPKAIEPRINRINEKTNDFASHNIENSHLHGLNIIGEIDLADDETEDSKQLPELEDDVRREIASAVPPDVTLSLSIEEALSRLPPIDRTCLEEEVDEFSCTCILKENPRAVSDFSVEEDGDCDASDDQLKDKTAVLEDKYIFIEDCNCPAKGYLLDKYRLGPVEDYNRISDLHRKYVDGVNGNFGLRTTPMRAEVSTCGSSGDVSVGGGGHEGVEGGSGDSDSAAADAENYNTLVPNFYEIAPKHVDRDTVCENYKKYSISKKEPPPSPPSVEVKIESDTEECVESENVAADSNVEFKEFHVVLERPSYNGEILRILPYVIID